MPNYAAIRSAEKFEAFVSRLLEEGKPFGLDIESGYTGPDTAGAALLPFHPRWLMVGFSFTNSVEWARYVPVAHDTGQNVDDPRRVAVALWRLLQSGQGVAHNASFELLGLSRWFRDMLSDDPELGLEVRRSKGIFPVLSDTLIEAYCTGLFAPQNVTFPNGAHGPGIGLKGLTKFVFDHQMVEFKNLFDKYTTKVRFNSLPPEGVNTEYACEDSVECLRLHLKHYPLVKDSFIFKTEMQLQPVLIEMEMEGLLLDWGKIHEKTEEVAGFRDLMNEEIMANLSERLGEVINFNLSSTKELGALLFDRLNLPVKQRSEKTNAASTGEKALRAIAQRDPVIKSILEYREVTKLHGSYLHKYDTELNYCDCGRAHPNHKQTGAATGRMSVDQVSYQQWPKPYHYELGSGKTFDLNFRDLLLSPSEYRIVGFDFSQVELRVLAGLANEKALLRAFADGTDIHKATAASMMGIPVDQVTKKQRSQGKTLNFAVVYGSGPANIAELLTTPEARVTTEDAQELLTKYFAAFPSLKGWMDEQVAFGRKHGYVETPFGRHFSIWEYHSTNGWIVSKGDRMCVNAPVQGGAADYMKIGMVRAVRAIKRAGMAEKIRLVMTVHDALEFYVHESVSTQEVIDLINPQVSFKVKHLPNLPEILAEWHEGPTWGSVVDVLLDSEKKVGGYSVEGIEEVFESWQQALASAHPDPVTEPEVEQERPIPVEETPSAYTISMPRMPDGQQLTSFLAFMSEHPGPHPVVVASPAGDITMDTRHTIPPFAVSQISILLGGATVTESKQGMTLDSFVKELDL